MSEGVNDLERSTCSLFQMRTNPIAARDSANSFGFVFSTAQYGELDRQSRQGVKR
jgi:hypothetical protein